MLTGFLGACLCQYIASVRTSRRNEQAVLSTFTRSHTNANTALRGQVYLPVWRPPVD
jgi:hypothetical protein